MDWRNCFRGRALCALGLSSLLVIGCGGTGEKGLVPVSGRVTLDGGAWPKAGKITFVPSAKDAGAQKEMRPAGADFDTSGHFTISSFEGVKGLYPGEYWGSVECWEVLPGMGDPGVAKVNPKTNALIPGAGKSYVPQKYQNPEKSGIVLMVEPGTALNPTFDVKTK